MQDMLTGKRALVTGASRGIGAAIAKALAANGADVAITYEKSTDLAAGVIQAIGAYGRRGAAIRANSANAEDVRMSVERTVAELGGLDILVNNAGVLRIANVADMPVADIDALLNVNVRAPILASKAAIPHIKSGGRIINIGSFFADRVPASVLGVYAGSKSALVAFTRGLARELGPKEITVNLVQPGSINTDMNPAEGMFSETLKMITAFGRYGSVDEVAHAVAFLADPKSQYITGAALTVDGGAVA
jgi:NAD(P)-dependent dehydrogenase (short-subunit alcohol dehydrogenase family)